MIVACGKSLSSERKLDDPDSSSDTVSSVLKKPYKNKSNAFLLIDIYGNILEFYATLK